MPHVDISAFGRSFGCDPVPGDPLTSIRRRIFRLPTTVGNMNAELQQAMGKAAIRLEIVYGYKKTSVLVMADTPLPRWIGRRGMMPSTSISGDEAKYREG